MSDTVLLEKPKCCLICVDLQNDFIDGSLGTPGAKQIVGKINGYISQQPTDLIVFTQDWHIDPGTHWAKPGAADMEYTFPEHCRANTEGAALSLQLSNLNKADAIFKKGHYSGGFSAFEAILDTPNQIEISLHSWLQSKQVDSVLVCGLLLDYCVSATALDAKQLGYACGILKAMSLASGPARAADTYELLEQQQIELV